MNTNNISKDYGTIDFEFNIPFPANLHLGTSSVQAYAHIGIANAPQAILVPANGAISLLGGQSMELMQILCGNTNVGHQKKPPNPSKIL